MSLNTSTAGQNSPFRLFSNSNNARLTFHAPAAPVSSSSEQKYQHLYVLPVLLLEFLAIALTRAILPGLLLQKYGDNVYLVMGCTECVRGLLAFAACPFFGKLSDVIGRKVCLFVTVLGTCAPVCVLAFFSWDTQQEQQEQEENTIATGSDDNFWSSLLDPASNEIAMSAFHPNAVTVFVILLALSGLFASTFTLVFAYISDTVRHQDERVAAYGLALATFGLSFTVGPIVGGYLAQQNKQYVFLTSMILTIIDLLYIYYILPESRPIEAPSSAASTISLMTMDHNFSSYKPWDSLRLIATDPFLRKVGEVAFLYYTGLWALISTLSVYAVKRFHLTPERLGELMSALGLSTMLAEAVLVRIMVPWLGEKKAMKVGLVSFALQCVVLGFATEGWHLFVCALFSLLGNLVYPSLSSLVSGSVEPDAVGEALGAINGIKALTEGIGPLVFGSLMTLSETSALPGWPYLLASLLVLAAYKVADELPDLEEDDYIHELERKRKGGVELFALGRNMHYDDEVEGLLSEIDEFSDNEETGTL